MYIGIPQKKVRVAGIRKPIYIKEALGNGKNQPWRKHLASKRIPLKGAPFGARSLFKLVQFGHYLNQCKYKNYVKTSYAW